MPVAIQIAFMHVLKGNFYFTYEQVGLSSILQYIQCITVLATKEKKSVWTKTDEHVQCLNTKQLVIDMVNDGVLRRGYLIKLNSTPYIMQIVWTSLPTFSDTVISLVQSWEIVITVEVYYLRFMYTVCTWYLHWFLCRKNTVLACI